MPVLFPDRIQHNNPNYPVVYSSDVKGGLQQVSTFSNVALSAAFSQQTSKFQTGSLLVTLDSNVVYFLGGNTSAGNDPLLTSSWVEIAQVTGATGQILNPDYCSHNYTTIWFNIVYGREWSSLHNKSSGNYFS